MTKTKVSVLILAGLFFCILFMLVSQIIPVQGATHNDWHAKTFWYEPWGSSGVHKGIDIFAKKGTPVIASTAGIVIYSGTLPKGGKVALILGPKWRVHYYAHLEQNQSRTGQLVAKGEVIGTLGDSGNAKGKPAHIHYSVVTLIPYPWRFTTETQGYKKMFYLNPAELFTHH
ncbi:L-Ala--D-Glu endopeptidase precursor [Pseudoalteromonas sp. P1-9]|nr:L-Ala--D-Glu endopeptidase precursor [Pseudoalteromonas sp. P1-9]